MKNILKLILQKGAIIFDFLLLPLTIISAVWFKIIKFIGIQKMSISEKILLKYGVIPVVNHYFETYIDPYKLDKTKIKNRKLENLDLNIKFQLTLLSEFVFQKELTAIYYNNGQSYRFQYNNGAYNLGDADFLYSLIRKNKPKQIIEIGSGYSTLMSIEAITKNYNENPYNRTKLTCIEPYEHEWLKNLPVTLVREKIENLPNAIFQSLDQNDILFVDSTHVVKAQGDVLHEIFEILPLLKSGVYIHFHDIFTPNDYPIEWFHEYRNWTEQYLLEAFLLHNSSYEIVGALNYLHNNHFEELAHAFPTIKNKRIGEPGSLWIRKK